MIDLVSQAERYLEKHGAGRIQRYTQPVESQPRAEIAALRR